MPHAKCQYIDNRVTDFPAEGRGWDRIFVMSYPLISCIAQWECIERTGKTWVDSDGCDAENDELDGVVRNGDGHDDGVDNDDGHDNDHDDDDDENDDRIEEPVEDPGDKYCLGSLKRRNFILPCTTFFSFLSICYVILSIYWTLIIQSIK